MSVRGLGSLPAIPIADGAASVWVVTHDVMDCGTELIGIYDNWDAAIEVARKIAADRLHDPSPEQVEPGERLRIGARIEVVDVERVEIFSEPKSRSDH